MATLNVSVYWTKRTIRPSSLDRLGRRPIISAVSSESPSESLPMCTLAVTDASVMSVSCWRAMIFYTELHHLSADADSKSRLRRVGQVPKALYSPPSPTLDCPTLPVEIFPAVDGIQSFAIIVRVKGVLDRCKFSACMKTFELQMRAPRGRRRRDRSPNGEARCLRG